MTREQKYRLLTDSLRKFPGVAVAFSGGLDSTFLLSVAKYALGENVLALTLSAPYIPQRELIEAEFFCKENNIRHIVLSGNILDELSMNPVNRCYLCKRHVFHRFRNEAVKQGIETVIDGTNADDTKDFRPGIKALRELNIMSPLLENGITKKEIRSMSKKLGLASCDKPPNACLFTRIPYNTKVLPKDLERIEKAEDLLYTLGFREVRVRLHGNIARIELNKSQFKDMIKETIRNRITDEFKQLGFQYITIDLEGYRTGSFINNTENQ